MTIEESVKDLILRGFKVSSVCDQLHVEQKQIKSFVIHPSRSEIAGYQIAYIKERYSDSEIESAFRNLKRADDLQTKINRLEYITLGCAFGLYKTVFETLLGRERFGTISKQFRKQKTEKTVMERYGVTSVSHIPTVIEKRRATIARHEQAPVQKQIKHLAITVDLIDQVKDLSLRGFSRQYIHTTLHVSYPIMREINFQPSRDEVVAYQVAYIRSHYTKSEIEAAVRQIHTMNDAQALANRRELYLLGCAFGSIAQPFSKLLGYTAYRSLVDQEVREKKALSGTLDNAREKRRQTMLRLYGVEEPNQNPIIAHRMIESLKKTTRQWYGVDYAMQVPEIAMEANKRRQETMMRRYGAANSVQIPEIRESIMEARRRNGTLSTSMFEVEMKRLLIERFGEHDVQHSVKVDDRYPDYVDFYIKSRDLFIEMNADASHCGHWYDPESDVDQKRLATLTERANGLNRPSRYRNSIRVWTVRDPEKRQRAKEHSLNYLVFWDNSVRVVDTKRIPNLRDFHEWLDAGCPDAKDWVGHEKNKY